MQKLSMALVLALAGASMMLMLMMTTPTVTGTKIEPEPGTAEQSATGETGQTNNERNSRHHLSELQFQHELEHPPLLADTKFWTRHNEFSDKINWRDKLKPCSLLETIAINEESVVSMGRLDDSYAGLLESNTKDLLLARNGLLLLDGIRPTDREDTLLKGYLNASGDCFGGELDSPSIDRIYQFEPHSDQLSWFNPDNWASSLNEDHVSELVPDANCIPCTEDEVVFGYKFDDVFDEIELAAGEPVPFKVNFRPSLALSESKKNYKNNFTIGNIRVSKLKIGDKFYKQGDFDQLVKSSQYENILFEFDHKLSLLRPQSSAAWYGYQPSNPLISIDESSIQFDREHNICLDEAGCMCGNENNYVMSAICSFHDQLQASDHPCLDPVPSSGYCNKICATVITIQMDPTKFSEKYMNSLIMQTIEAEPSRGYLSNHIFVAARRTHHARYEITLRLVFGHQGLATASLEDLVGRDLELALNLRSQLEISSLKSFYGIENIVIQYSNQWRTSNRMAIFIICLTISMLLTTGGFILEERALRGQNSGLDHINLSSSQQHLIGARGWIQHQVNSVMVTLRGRNSLNESDSFLRYAEPAISETDAPSEYSTSSGGIQLVEMSSALPFENVQLEYQDE